MSETLWRMGEPKKKKKGDTGFGYCHQMDRPGQCRTHVISHLDISALEVKVAPCEFVLVGRGWQNKHHPTTHQPCSLCTNGCSS